MEIILRKKPQNVRIIEGFPGLGLIGTIVTEYLIKHLKAKPIGYLKSTEIMPIAAVHESRLYQPLEIYYAQKENLVILHVLSDVRGLEWKVGEMLEGLYKKLKAREIISIEGVFSAKGTHNSYFLTTNNEIAKKFESLNFSPLKEGIVVGVTAALLLRSEKIKSTGLFVETNSQLPDSRSAAKIIEILDKYIGLDIDYEPLLKAAEKTEEKLKDLVEKARMSMKHMSNKKPDYMG